MGVFEIDDPSIDVAALEERVKAAIEAKRGVRFTDEELEELRDAELVPRLRREDLPRGWLDEASEVRSHMPVISPPPGVAASPTVTLYESGSGGLKGSVLRFARRWMRSFYRSTLNLEPTLATMIEATNEQGAWVSDIAGQLERWRERDLHLFHNMVTEITAMRLQQTHMQDRINELIRQLDALKERERALESLTVKERPQRAGTEV
jgi:hypothetical protein